MWALFRSFCHLEELFLAAVASGLLVWDKLVNQIFFSLELIHFYKAVLWQYLLLKAL